MHQDVLHRVSTPSMLARRPRYSLVWKLLFVPREPKQPAGAPETILTLTLVLALALALVLPLALTLTLPLPLPLPLPLTLTPEARRRPSAGPSGGSPPSSAPRGAAPRRLTRRRPSGAAPTKAAEVRANVCARKIRLFLPYIYPAAPFARQRIGEHRESANAIPNRSPIIIGIVR